MGSRETELNRLLIEAESIKFRLLDDSNENDVNGRPYTFSRILTDDMPMYNWHDETRIKTNHPFKCHWGQLKLLYSEIEFFNLVQINSGQNLVSNRENVPFYVVYAGSAGGHHITILLELFPALRFILYDPSQFDKTVFNDKKIFIRTGPDSTLNRDDRANGFTDEDTRYIQSGFYSTIVSTHGIPIIIRKFFKDNRQRISANNNNGYDVIFISDVRKTPNDATVFEDMFLQQDWGVALNAYMMLFKFRLPYSTPHNEGGINPNLIDDFGNPLPRIKFSEKLYEVLSPEFKSEKGIVQETNGRTLAQYYNDKLREEFNNPNSPYVFPNNRYNDALNGVEYLYLEGDIYLQLDAPYHSTETRLVVQRNTDGRFNLKYYNCQKYEAQCYYFNSTININRRFCLGDNKLIKHHIMGFDDGYASTAEYDIISTYIKRLYPSPEGPDKDDIEFGRIVKLLLSIHGMLLNFTVGRTLIECNVASFVKAMGLKGSGVDRDEVHNMDDVKLKHRLYQLMESFILTHRSCLVQKKLFKFYLENNIPEYNIPAINNSNINCITRRRTKILDSDFYRKQIQMINEAIDHLKGYLFDANTLRKFQQMRTNDENFNNMVTHVSRELGINRIPENNEKYITNEPFKPRNLKDYVNVFYKSDYELGWDFNKRARNIIYDIGNVSQHYIKVEAILQHRGRNTKFLADFWLTPGELESKQRIQQNEREKEERDIARIQAARAIEAERAREATVPPAERPVQPTRENRGFTDTVSESRARAREAAEEQEGVTAPVQSTRENRGFADPRPNTYSRPGVPPPFNDNYSNHRGSSRQGAPPPSNANWRQGAPPPSNANWRQGAPPPSNANWRQGAPPPSNANQNRRNTDEEGFTTVRKR
jgi:hypothetical protein